MIFFIFLIAIIASFKSCDCVNILMLSGIPSPSHYIFNKALAEGLANRGHNVTMISPDVDKKAVPNLHLIHLEQVYPYYYNDSEHIDLMEMSKETKIQSIISFYQFGAFMCEGIALSKGLDVIRNYPSDFKFDLVINDYTCGACLLGLLPKFKYPPLIGLSAFSNPPYTADIAGGDKLGLTTKPFYLLNYDKNMKFHERIHNALFNFVDSFYRKYFATPAVDRQMKIMFGPETPYAEDLDKMAALMLVNSNPAVDFPESLPPNVIEVGGLQIKDPKPLPKDIEEFLLKGKKGTVLMSLGTNIRSDQLGEEKINMIIEAFRSIPDFNFLWKFETSELLPKLPPNVKVSDWLPQNDLLAHPNLKMFISHGGMLSTHEATWWGVPVVGIPFLADQHRNLYKSVSSEVAVTVDVHTMTTQIFKTAVNEVLRNPKYQANMKVRSTRFRDQKEKPLERAIWWTEYVIRNPKPTHLKPAEFTIGVLGSHFWDVQIIFLAIIVLIFLGIKKSIKRAFEKQPEIKKSKKNN